MAPRLVACTFVATSFCMKFELLLRRGREFRDRCFGIKEFIYNGGGERAGEDEEKKNVRDGLFLWFIRN